MAEINGSLRRSWLKAKLVVEEVTALSPRTMRAIARNSVRMARLDKRDRANESTPAAAVTAGRMLTGTPMVVEGVTIGAIVAFERATLEVRFAADDLVLLSWGPDDAQPPWAQDPQSDLTAVGAVRVEIVEEGAELSTDAMRVVVANDGVQIFDPESSLRYHELPPLRRGAQRVHRRLLRPGERVAGLGEQAGSLDLRGRSYRLWNRDPGGAWGPGQEMLYCAMPVTFSRHPDGGALAFIENAADATVTIGAPRDDQPVELESRFVAGAVRTWVAIGGHESLLEAYTALTGRHDLPPRWALGYQQSRWGYSSSAELGEVLSGFKERGIPLSALHLDIDYMDDYRVFSVDEERFGGLRELSEAAAQQGARLITIVDPAIRRDPGYLVYDEGMEHGHFVTEETGEVHVGTVWPGWAVFPDFTRPATRAWWATKYPSLLDHGIAGLWHDMNEPTSITLAGDRTLPRSARHDNEGQGGDHRQAHNVYGMLMNEAGRTALEAHAPGRRPFIVSRSGWAGMQRSAWNWTGDVEASRKGLAQQIPTFLGLGLSGVGFTGSDIGGFSGVPSPSLYVRWLELGIVSPFCRTHSVIGAPPREPWCWPEETVARIDALIALRYRLLPLLYTEAAVTSSTGHPLLRPLWWGDENPRESIADCVDAMFVGERMIFALCTEPGDTERSVPLPEGHWWRWRPVGTPGHDDLDEIAEFPGGRDVTVDGRLGQPVLFVKGGSVIPLDDGWCGARRPVGGLRSDHAPSALSLHVFPDGDGKVSGDLYDDAGDGDGPHRIDRLTLEGNDLRWESIGTFPRPERITIVVHGRRVRSAQTDGRVLDSSRLSWNGASTTIECEPFSVLTFD